MTSGIVTHQYLDASDNLAQYAADSCLRQAVTAAFAYEHLVDENVYLFSAEADALGLEPWTLLQGMDKSSRDEPKPYFLEYGRAGSLPVAADFQVFVSLKTLARLGHVLPPASRYAPPARLRFQPSTAGI